MRTFIFYLLRIPAFLIINILFLPKVYNRKALHFRHKCIVIANHTSNWDPILLGHLVFPVCLRYMAKEEMFKNALFKNFLLSIGVIPVGRGKGDLKAMKIALSALKNGQSLGIFPEGHRSFSGDLLPFEIGPAVIAMKTKTPVLPVYLDCKGYRPFHRVKIKVGEMLDLNEIAGGQTDSKTVAQMTDVLVQKIAALKESMANG